MIRELIATEEEYNAAFERLEKIVADHPGEGFAEIIRDAVNDKPVRLSKVFFSLDAGNMRDVLTVMQCATTYGWKRISEESNPQPGD